MPTKPHTPSTKNPARDPANHRRLAREVILGAPLAALLWLGLIRFITGMWAFAFPGAILLFSALIGILLIGPSATAIPAYRVWKGLVFCIDFVVTRVVCAILFYGLFTPIALMLRLLGRQPMRMNPDSRKESYWEETPASSPDLRRYLRQF